MTLDWARIKEGIRWLLDHWYVPVTAVLGVLVYGIAHRGPRVQDRVQVELDAVAARREVRQQAIDQGAEAAHARVAEMFAQHQAQMSQEAQDAANSLRSDPAKLAAYLVRVGASLPQAVGVDAAPAAGAAAPNPGGPAGTSGGV